MSETRRQSAPMPFLDFIHNVQNDPQLLRVNLPEIFESPYDTSRPVDLLTPPFQESRDIREATEPDFQGWQPGERIRGTFNLGVANVARPGLPHPYLEVTASASYLATEDPSGRWDREQHALPTRFAINGGGELHPKAVATIARLGRLQIIADLVKTDA